MRLIWGLRHGQRRHRAELGTDIGTNERDRFRRRNEIDPEEEGKEKCYV